MQVVRRAARTAPCNARRARPRLSLRVARQSLEFVVAPCVAEYDFMSPRAKIIPSLPPINPEPRIPTRIPLYLAFRYLLLLSGPPVSAVLRGTEHLAPRSLRLRFPAAGDLRA